MLAADVSLVASGVGKGYTPDNLKDFLAGKGINAVEVVMLTKPEVVDQVRTLTFRVAVKPEEYEAALKPEVWPYRVGVRHFRAPRRVESSWQGQAERAGGLVDNGGVSPSLGQFRADTGGARQKQYLPPGHGGQAGRQQQQVAQAQAGTLELRNMFSLLSALNGGLSSPSQHP